MPIGLYEDHAIKCEFEAKIKMLKGSLNLNSVIFSKTPTGVDKKVKKSDTKKCIYCDRSYMDDKINEHEK